MKNKRIINFTLVFVLILSLFNYLFTSVAFADEYSDWVSVGDSNSLRGVEGISTLYENSIFAIDEVARVQIENGGLDISDYDYIAKGCDIGARYGIELRFIPKDCICVRTQYTNTNVDKEYYNWTCYSYDGYQLVQEYFIGRSVVEVGNTSCYQAKYSREFDTPTSPESPFFLDYQCKWAPSEEYALKYFQTMDVSYLGNGADYVHVPSPKNVSFYLAKDENGGYVYYENESYSLNGFDLKTRLVIVYSYIDASGERVDISMNEVDLDYLTRNQYFIDFAPLENYDTGCVAINVFNYASNGSVMAFCDEPKSIEYSLNSDFFTWYEYGTDDIKKIPIVDYGKYNPSYTGGVGGGSISPGIDSDYGFLDGVFNAFGLIGENGLIQFMGELFSFIPTPIIVALSGFVFAAIIIALFKMFVK